MVVSTLNLVGSIIASEQTCDSRGNPRILAY